LAEVFLRMRRNTLSQPAGLAVLCTYPALFTRTSVPLWRIHFYSSAMLNAVIDLSHYNDPVNFEAAAADGLLGVVHKATEGLANSDLRYAERRPLAQSVGLFWGAYHLGHSLDGAAQASHYLAVVGDTTAVLLMLDLEVPPGDPGMGRVEAEIFVEAVYAATGRYPGIYSTPSYLAAIGAAQSTVLSNCWLWMADYRLVAEPEVPSPWKIWTMWQYTDGTTGNEPRTVAGIGPCDRDKFNGELAGLHALWGVAMPPAQSI
jgi:lysozyme